MRKQAARQASGDHAHVFGVLLIQVCQEASTHDGSTRDFRVSRQGANNLGRKLITFKPNILAYDPHGEYPQDTWNSGLKPGSVVIGHPVLQLHAPRPAGVLLARLLGRLHTANQDIVAAELLDGFLGFIGRPLPDRQHRNDRAHAEDDAQHGER